MRNGCTGNPIRAAGCPMEWAEIDRVERPKFAFAD